MMITNKDKEKGFQEQVPEQTVTAKPSLLRRDKLIFKHFADAGSESEKAGGEFSEVSEISGAKPSSAEDFAGVSGFSGVGGVSFAEDSGQGILSAESGLYPAAVDGSAGVQSRASESRYSRLPQKQVAAKLSGFKASSKEVKFPGPAHNPVFRLVLEL